MLIGGLDFANYWFFQLLCIYSLIILPKQFTASIYFKFYIVTHETIIIDF